MSTTAIAFVADADQARVALTSIRRQLLERLREPGSAVRLAEELGIARQKIGYHLRALEGAGLIRLVEERPRRGFTERIFVACADAFVMDPSMMGAPDPAAIDAQDRFASDHLVRTAAAVVRDVARMREAAEEQGTRLLTLTVEAELAFATPGDFDCFTEELSQAVAALARRYKTSNKPNNKKGRRYRLLAAAHPAVHTKATPAVH
jgi:DNA-binding transcriptional ArsR family regulator